MDLQALLNLWRDCRSAALSEAIALVGPRIEVTDLALLDGAAPDPRIAYGVVAALEAGRLWSHLGKAHELILQHGDLRIAAALESKSLGPFMNGALSVRNFWPKTALELHRLLAGRETDAARDMHLLAEARAASPPRAPVEAPPVAARSDDGAALLAAIYDDPRSTAAREVYADFLIERGDPRGEFIALQCRGGSKKREGELLRKHVDAWLGPIAPLVLREGRVFERGFLHEARVTPRGSAVNARALGAIEWATVADLDLSVWRSAPDVATQDTLRALRTLRGVDPLWMAHVPLSAPHVVLYPGDWFGPRTVNLLVAQAQSCVWKNVQHLELSIPPTTQFGSFWQSNFARGLAELTISFVQPAGLLPIAALAATPIPIVRVMREPELPDDWRIELVRDGGGHRLVRATAVGAPPRAMLDDTLRAIPRNVISRLEVG